MKPSKLKSSELSLLYDFIIAVLSSPLRSEELFSLINTNEYSSLFKKAILDFKKKINKIDLNKEPMDFQTSLLKSCKDNGEASLAIQRVIKR